MKGMGAMVVKFSRKSLGRLKLFRQHQAMEVNFHYRNQIRRGDQDCLISKQVLPIEQARKIRELGLN